MAISVRLDNEEADLIRAYAKLKGISVSELVRKSVIEAIEDELDLKAYDQAMREYREHPVSFSLDEVEREMGLK